jgi:hypothetical protein
MANRSVEEFKNKKFIKLNFRFDISKGFLKLNKSCIKSNQFCKWLGSKKNLLKKFWWWNNLDNNNLLSTLKEQS